MSKLKTMLSNGGCLGCTGRALLTIEGPYWSLAKRRSFAVMLRDSAFSMGCVRYSCGQMGNRLGRCQLLFVGKKIEWREFTLKEFFHSSSSSTE